MAARSDPGPSTAETPTPEGGAQATRECVQRGRGRPRKTAKKHFVVTIANVEFATHTTIQNLSPSFSLVVANELLEEVYNRKGDYIKTINDHIEGGVLQLDETTTRLRKCVERKAGRLHSMVTRASGSRKRMVLSLQKKSRFVVGKGEAVNVHLYYAMLQGMLT